MGSQLVARLDNVMVSEMENEQAEELEITTVA